jgi:mannitol-1-phosphate 5-dehydrogenase
MIKKTVLIWGAGRIGRGFVADLFNAAGYHLILVDQSAELVAQLRQTGQFTVVRAANATERTDQLISNFTALTTAQIDEVAAAVVAAETVVLAVYPQDFAQVTRQLVPGLTRRQAERADVPLDIILCTNLAHAAVEFEEQLQQALPPPLRPYAAEKIGLVESLVIRMVAEPPAVLKQQEPLLVWTNGYDHLPVDRRGFKGNIPRLPGLRLVEDMWAEEVRKLYTYNMGHAVLAYHGARRGYSLAVDCLHDPEVRAEAEGALAEVSRALQLEYGFGAEEMTHWNENVLRQTDNPTLGDTVARHGADPRRKLRRTDRLVGPALLVHQHHVSPDYLSRAIAAAFLFDQPGDPGAAFVQERVAAVGLEAAVYELCELNDDEKDLVELIVEAYRQLEA